MGGHHVVGPRSPRAIFESAASRRQRAASSQGVVVCGPSGQCLRQGCWGMSVSLQFFFYFLSSCSCGRAEALRAPLPQQAWCFGSRYNPVRMGSCEEGRHKGQVPWSSACTEMEGYLAVTVSQPGLGRELAPRLMARRSWSGFWWEQTQVFLSCQIPQRKKKNLSEKGGGIESLGI